MFTFALFIVGWCIVAVAPVAAVGQLLGSCGAAVAVAACCTLALVQGGCMASIFIIFGCEVAYFLQAIYMYIY